MSYDGDDPDDFMSLTEIVAYLERYAAAGGIEVRTGVEVTSLEAAERGLRLETSFGQIAARAVVVCTGAYQRAFRPQGADGLPDDLVTLDARSYRAPASLPAGAVLVVGNGQSGCQIAEELCEAGREVVVSCGKAAWAPRRTGEHDLLWWGLETRGRRRHAALAGSPVRRERHRQRHQRRPRSSHAYASRPRRHTHRALHRVR
jgi:putative flavoprotein involved in K+ transport